MASIAILESIAVSQGFASLGAYVDDQIKQHGSWDPEEVHDNENTRDVETHNKEQAG